jgi:hypothetical protein
MVLQQTLDSLRSQRLFPGCLGDLANEFSPGQIHFIMDCASFGSRIVFEDFHPQPSFLDSQIS